MFNTFERMRSMKEDFLYNIIRTTPLLLKYLNEKHQTDIHWIFQKWRHEKKYNWYYQTYSRKHLQWTVCLYMVYMRLQCISYVHYHYKHVLAIQNFE